MMRLMMALLAAHGSVFAAEDNAPVLPKLGAGSAVASANVGNMLAAFVLVIACLLLVSWLLRRSRLVTAPNQAGVSVLAQLPLNMKEKLLVVQVGEERLLLGTTPGCIRTLHCWKADEPTPPVKPRHFASLLSGLNRRADEGQPGAAVAKPEVDQ